MIEFVGVHCETADCRNIHQKLLVMGDKVLRYTDPDKRYSTGDEGIVYRIGKSINMKKDPLNRPRSGTTPDEYAILSAEYTGVDLILDERYGSKRNPVDYAEYRIIVRFPQCNTCELITYTLAGVYHGKYSAFEFKGGLCRVTR